MWRQLNKHFHFPPKNLCPAGAARWDYRLISVCVCSCNSDLCVCVRVTTSSCWWSRNIRLKMFPLPQRRFRDKPFYMWTHARTCTRAHTFQCVRVVNQMSRDAGSVTAAVCLVRVIRNTWLTPSVSWQRLIKVLMFHLWLKFSTDFSAKSNWIQSAHGNQWVTFLCVCAGIALHSEDVPTLTLTCLQLKSLLFLVLMFENIFRFFGFLIMLNRLVVFTRKNNKFQMRQGLRLWNRWWMSFKNTEIIRRNVPPVLILFFLP